MRRLAHGHKPQWQGHWRCLVCPSVGRTFPNALVFVCIRREAGGRHSNVHHGRSFPGAPKPLRRDRPRMSNRRRPNGPESSTSIVTLRPPGARLDMICRFQVIMSGAACVGALLQRLVQVVCNSGVALVFPCRLFSVSLPKGTFWFLTGNGAARCAHAHHCALPLRGVEDLPRGLARTGLVRLLPQAMKRPQGHLHFHPRPLHGSLHCATFSGRRHQATGPNWAPRAGRG